MVFSNDDCFHKLSVCFNIVNNLSECFAFCAGISRLAGAWRLAQFNVHPTHEYFVGLPIPAAGIVVALLAIFSFVSPLIMIGLALLMISPIQVPKI